MFTRRVSLASVVAAVAMVIAPATPVAAASAPTVPSDPPITTMAPPDQCGDVVTFNQISRNGNTVSTQMVVVGLDSMLPAWSDYGILRLTWFRQGNPYGEAAGPWYPARNGGLVVDLTYNSAEPVYVRVGLSTEEDIYTVCEGIYDIA